MKKTEKYILALLLIVFGVAFIVLKTKFIGVLTTVFGVALVALGVLDVIKGTLPTALLKILFGLIVAVCGWFLVEAVFYVIAACLLALGGYVLYKRLRENRCDGAPLSLICEYALPVVSIAVGVLLLLHQTALMNIIFVLCGLLTVLAGVTLFLCTAQDED